MPNSHTLDQNLQRLITARTNITDAITAKGGTVSQGDGFEDFPSDIASITNTYTQVDEGKVVSNRALVAQTAYPSEITVNDTYDTTNYSSVTVNVPSASDAYKLSFTSSAYGGRVTSELYSINSNSSTSVFGYFDLTPKTRSNQDYLTFSFDSAFTPSFTSVKLNSFTSANNSANCSGSILSNGKYRVDISTNGYLYENSTYRFYIQNLFV